MKILIGKKVKIKGPFLVLDNGYYYDKIGEVVNIVDKMYGVRINDDRKHVIYCYKDQIEEIK